MPGHDAKCTDVMPTVDSARDWSGLPFMARIVFLWFVLLPHSAAAQLRPLEPVTWRAHTHEASVQAGIGLGVFGEQRASLAGTRGTLLELGNWFVTYRSGRFALEFAGTAVRSFDDDDVLAPSFHLTDPPDGEARVDAGDVRIGTLLRVAGDGTGPTVLLRFGTRLPTPSDEPGLDRDRTDFFGTAAARAPLRTGVHVFGEAGVGIHSTVDETYPQSDVLIYNAGVDIGSDAAGLRFQVLGHDDLHRRVVRGNEDLAELRLGAWIGDRRRIEAHVVRGLAEFSPGWGVLVTAGISLW